MQPPDFLADLYKEAPKQETNYGFIFAVIVLILVVVGWWYFKIREKKVATPPASPKSAPVLEETAAPNPSVKRWTLEPHV